MNTTLTHTGCFFIVINELDFIFEGGKKGVTTNLLPTNLKSLATSLVCWPLLACFC